METKKSKQHVENFLLKINNIKAIVVNIVFVAINWYETEKSKQQKMKKTSEERSANQMKEKEKFRAKHILIKRNARLPTYFHRFCCCCRCTQSS